MRATNNTQTCIIRDTSFSKINFFEKIKTLQFGGAGAGGGGGGGGGGNGSIPLLGWLFAVVLRGGVWWFVEIGDVGGGGGKEKKKGERAETIQKKCGEIQ